MNAPTLHAEAHFYGSKSAVTEPAGPVADFVRAHGGHSVITKVLICNNGIAAVKEIRSVRKWAYETFGDERAIQFTVMATPEDLRVNAEYIRLADQYVEVPGGSNANNYANVELIVDIAERAGVHAVWAGWGHASENPRLPEMLTALRPRVLFIGPPGSAMRSLGDKISSTIVAQHAQVPCLQWSGTGVTETMMSSAGYLTVSDETYRRACVQSAEEGLEVAQRIGFPVMIKASEGGGGKGIRMCASAESFIQLYTAAVGEVPGSPIFVMKLAGQARHLEVQLLADQYGNVISIFGRDCSVQRRHQKIIEEAPVSVAPPATCMAMEQAAVRLAKLVGYVSAGTVEWLYSHDSGEFSFLELNPRLQVEHPTTEMVSGVNIPAAQLQIAMGLPLYGIDDVRALYGEARGPATPIDFASRDAALETRPRPRGHVIACRITAENPDTGFQPGVGLLSELNFRSSPATWGYFSVGPSGALHEFADSQFGHVFAHGADRDAARKHMVYSLKELSIRGEFRTTVEYLVMLLETSVFCSNAVTTAWLDGLIAQQATAERPPRDLAVVCGATVKALRFAHECVDEYKRVLHRGQVPPRNTLRISFPIEFIYANAKYAMTATQSAPFGWRLHLNGGAIEVSVRELSDGGVLIGLAGRSHTVYWLDEVGQTRLTIDGRTCVIEDENDPTQICSPSPGKLVRLLVESGDHVVAGQSIAEIEVMKMYLPLVAQEDGVVTFVRSPGVSLNPGDLLGLLAVDDPSKITRAAPFTERLPHYGPPDLGGTKPHQRFERARVTLAHVLAGYDQDAAMGDAVSTLVDTMRLPQLPFLQTAQVMSSLGGRLPPAAEADLRAELQRADGEYPAAALRAIVDAAVAQTTDSAARLALTTAVAPLYAVLDMYRGGLYQHEMMTLCRLLEAYADVEVQFMHGPEAVLRLRAAAEGDLDQVVALYLSHMGCARKNALLLLLLDRYVRHSSMVSKTEPSQRMIAVLQRLSALRGPRTAPVALKAREILLDAQMPSLAERQAQMEAVLRSSVTGEDGAYRAPMLDVLRELSDTPYNLFDVLHTFFAHASLPLAYAALVTYVMRAYRAYDIVAFNFATETIESRDYALVTWSFQLSPEVLANRAKEKERQASTTDLADYMQRRTRPKLRVGTMTSCLRLSQLGETLERTIKYFGTPPAEPVNVLNVAITDDEQCADAAVLPRIAGIVEGQAAQLSAAGLRRVTVLLCQPGVYPLFVTYRRLDTGEWREQRSIQNVEPALAYQLELDRITPNFEITPVPMSSSSVHLYFARGLSNKMDQRFFVRALIRPGHSPTDMPQYLLSESDRVLNDVLNMLEVSLGRREFAQADGSHIFVSWLYPLSYSLEDVQSVLAMFIERHRERLQRLRVEEAEIRVVLHDPSRRRPRPLRITVTTETVFTLRYHVYEEVIDAHGAVMLQSIDARPHDAPLHGKGAHTAYPNRGAFATRRARAQRLGTTFVYELVDAVRHALRVLHAEAAGRAPERALPGHELPDPVLSARELLLTADGLVPVERAPAHNTIGMVAWQLELATPEYPAGRPLYLVANDVTLQAGSFGPAEDALFAAVSRRACAERTPLLYVSSNSGARLGLASEPLDVFRAKFVADDPTRGFEYLYVDDAALATLPPGCVRTRPLATPQGTHHVLTDVIGSPRAGLGVECLSGSGSIAGEMSRARHAIFTTTIVTGRSVGIGAYLARLGGRVIQVENAPIILTGFQALNRLLGREVYTSNLQLGGPQIMFSNGVSHIRASSDLEAMCAYLRWLAFVPARAGEPLRMMPPRDPVDRAVTFVPTPTPYDPRAMISGAAAADGGFCDGLFDRGSFQETLAGWATSVVVGRARLGGIPFGVIAVETRTFERIVPADPANPPSTEQRIMEAGQVWYPNSAYKTAQAIYDFEREGLPLMMLANWRGFSGGQQDMYDEVLKQGSKIVDALATYSHPVFVHIPPAGELRGGSWVVIDSTVNARGMIEMSADTDSARGGVLEAAGLVEIKYRADKQRATMERLDPTYAALAAAARDAQLSNERANAAAQLQEREKQIAPFFHAIAVEYADAHDRAGRMLATGVLRCAVPWADTRRYFYWRARRRLAEVRAERALLAADTALELQDARARVRATAGYVDSDADEAVALRLESAAPQLDADVARQRMRALREKIAQLAPTERAELLQLL